MTARTLHQPAGPARSVFAGLDICGEAGFTMPEVAHRPVFEEDLWDFTQVIGLPIQQSLCARRLDFAAIADPRWRLVAKELAMAMLAPRHDAVAHLPRGYRTPLHLNTVHVRLAELTRFFTWATGQGVAGLADIDEQHCAAYLSHRRYVRDGGVVVGQRGPATRRAVAQVLGDLVNYRELFTADRVDVALRPWGGATPSMVAEEPRRAGPNTTPPVSGHVLQPMLAAAEYLVTVLGPQAVQLAGQVQDADRRWSLRSGQYAALKRMPSEQFTRLLAGYERRGEPLPLMSERALPRRLAAGWSPDDPLTPISLGLLARQVGIAQFQRAWLPQLRERIEATLRVVGAEHCFGRGAALVDRADGQGPTAWTRPLDRGDAAALIGIVRTAAIVVVAAVAGMRSSELMELRVGCCLPPERFGADLARYRLASTIIKGQPLGGLADEWVVIEPAYRAAQLLQALHPSGQDGAPLIGRFSFRVRYQWFRAWVNGSAGARLGLTPIPADPVSLRALRRTLALELAYRPGGVLATKFHLKHVAVATTEGYASRPGGAQAELLAEINKHEADRNLDLVLAEFRAYQQGIRPAGPGARELTGFFAHVDALTSTIDAGAGAGASSVQHGDREILNLLSKRAATLHLQPGNYCWFTDPSRALCLKLAGTPNADKPLAGMCDSARCPQATHHGVHRDVWAAHAETTKTFLGALGRTRKAEKSRLQGEYDRARRVLDQIDESTNTTAEAED